MLAAEQQALSAPTQLQPERPLEDFAADPLVPKESGRLRFGFLKVNHSAATTLPSPRTLAVPSVPLYD